MERLPERDQPQTQTPWLNANGWSRVTLDQMSISTSHPSSVRLPLDSSVSASDMGSVWTSDSNTASASPPAHIESYRRCYSTVNLLHLTFRAICIVVNCILQTDGNNWVLKGIMSVTATFGRIYTIAIDWLVLVALCWAFGVFCCLFLFFFYLLNNCEACYKDLPFVELIYHCFFIFLFF